MAYSPIAFIAPNYRDYRNWWLKAYEPATTTTKTLALESNGGTQVAKLQLNADGFLESAGGAIVMPYIDGSYDAYLFPTESEADSNDTSNAVRVADDITVARGTDDYIAIKTLAGAVADTSAQAGDYVRISDRGHGLFEYKMGQANNGTWIVECTGIPTLSLVLVQQGKEVRLSNFGDNFGINGDCTAQVKAARDYCQDGVADLVLDGQFRITDEIAFNKDINIYGMAPSTYKANGTVIWVDVNDGAKAGFFFGRDTSPILCRFYGAKFVALSTSWASMRQQAATFFGGDYHFDANGGIGNGIYIAEHYIGSIERVEVTGKTYGMKITGNTSCVIRDLNVNGASEGASLQIANMLDGHLKFQDIYLEAQHTQSLSITDCNKFSIITLDGIYEENSSVETVISNSHAVEIKNMRTNVVTKGILVQNGSKQCSIEVRAVDRFEGSPVVTVEDGCDCSVTVTYNEDTPALDGRDYALIVGELSGVPAISSNCNSKLYGSANNTLLQCSDGTLTATVPPFPQRVSNHSILVTSGQAIRLPMTRWEKGKRYAIKLVYQSESVGETAFQVRIQNGSATKIFQYFHTPDPAFKTLTFAFTAPDVDIDEYTSLDFYSLSGSANVHYMSIAEVGSGFLPSGMDDNELEVIKEVSLGAVDIYNILPASRDYKFSSWDVVNSTGVAAGGVFEVGILNAGLVMTRFIEFTTSSGNVGVAQENATSYRALKDQRNSEPNGVAVSVTSAGTGNVNLVCRYKIADKATV